VQQDPEEILTCILNRLQEEAQEVLSAAFPNLDAGKASTLSCCTQSTVSAVLLRPVLLLSCLTRC